MTGIAEGAIKAGRVAWIWLWAWLASEATVAASALCIVVTYGGFPVLPGHDSWREAANFASNVTVSIVMLVYLVTAVPVLRWIYRSAVVACAASDRVVVTPGWAVGRFFIPVLNAWRPFQGVAEIWRATANPADPDTVATPPILRWWWGLWLATSLVGYIDARLGLQASTPAERIDAGWADVILFALNIPLVVVLVRIIRELSVMQSALLTQRAAAIDEGHAS